jgi:hypothetical protein
MPYFSAHAIVIHQNKALFNQEHEDFGPLLPSGRFDKEDFDLIGRVSEEDLSSNVVKRELKEELKPDIISLNQYLGCFSDDIATKSGKSYHIEKMYFWKVDIEPKELGTLQGRTPIPLMYLNSEEIESKTRSPAMKQIAMKFLG